MYHDEHPPPHFDASCEGFEAFDDRGLHRRLSEAGKLSRDAAWSLS
jgi:hypothetical protein